MIRTLVAVGMALAGVSAAQAQTAPTQTLKRVEQDLASQKTRQQDLDKQAETLSQELLDLRAKLVGSAEEAARLESELDELEARLDSLESDEKSRTDRLAANREQVASLLAALQRLARTPPEALLARPGGPVDAARSALLLSATVPTLRAQAASLAIELKELADTRAQLTTQRQQVAATREVLSGRQRELAALVDKRTQLSRRTDSERTQVTLRMGRLAGQATDLRQLMEKVEAERRAEEAARAKAEAERQEAERRLAARREAERRDLERRLAEQNKPATPADRTETRTAATVSPPSGDDISKIGNLRLPVTGRVTVRYGEADRFGVVSRGVTITARPGTTVVSPFAGQIQFAGPFKGYGQILIVEHGHGYHSLLAGLGRIDSAVGQQVSAGEPVGGMEQPTDGHSNLYYELRRNGQPVNPQRGLSTQDGKGRG